MKEIVLQQSAGKLTIVRINISNSSLLSGTQKCRELLKISLSVLDQNLVLFILKIWPLKSFVVT